MENQNNKEEEFEKYCYMCRRPEGVAGKMVKMHDGLHICSDCMQRSFDAISNGSMNHILNNPDVKVEAKTPAGKNINLKDIDINGLLSSLGIQGNTIDSDEMEKDTATETTEEDKKEKKPSISFINLGMLNNDGSNKQKVKKRSSEDKKPLLDLNKIMPPHKIKQKLDEYVIGQEYAKKAISVAVYNHYKRVATDAVDDIEIEKSNMLMVGPTGSGKTFLVKTLARVLDVPLAIADATLLTEAGYIGDDIESVVSKLLAAADNDVDKAETGIIFIDEIDKIAKKKNVTNRDVSGESVQQGMLKLLEGADIEVPVGASSKNAMVPMTTINTKNILFICGGAFPDLEDIIKERLNNQAAIGFHADLKDKYDSDRNLVSKVTVDDLRKYGMIPEFLGRLPIIFTLEELTKEMLVKVLQEPKNAILKQYQRLLQLDEVKLEFDESAMEAIAERALEKQTGARALRSIIEEFMLDIMYEIPKDDNIGTVTITGDYIENKGAPIIEMRRQSIKKEYNEET